MKLKDFAKTLGVSYATALRMMKRGHIPGAFKLPSGTIIVPDDSVSKLAYMGSNKMSLSAFILHMKDTSRSCLSEEDIERLEAIFASAEGELL